MSLLTNPGLEDGTDGITLAGLAEVSSDTARSGTYSGLLRSRKGVIGQPDGTSEIRWDAVVADTSREYTLFYFYNGDSANQVGIPLIVEVKYVETPDVWTEVDRVTVAEKESGWAGRGSFTITPAAGAIYVRFRTGSTTVSLYNTRWYIDDIILYPVPRTLSEIMAVSKWAAVAALKTQLLKVVGQAAGFRSDIGSRVYDRLIVPEDGVEIARPYICMPLLSEDQSYDVEDKLIKTQWTHRVHIFVDETQSEPDKTSSAEALADMHDDIVKTLMEDWTLGGAVKDLTILGANTFPATSPDDRYGELVMDIQLTQWFQRSELGVTT